MMASTRNSNTNGVLAIPASVTSKKANTTSAGANISPKSGARRLRLIIRRLPPGLTEVEFGEILGKEWQVGGGKVDWSEFKDGKISKDSAKPSRPSRAYLRVKDQGMLDSLSAFVKERNFLDAKNTGKDPCLLGPPSLEFAPYGRVPGNRARKDGRQGTIDQDPEFIDFLQSLTEPVTKITVNGDGAEGIDAKPAKATTTPLVEYLKEKKLNKGKEIAASKSVKSLIKPDSKESREAKETKGEKAESRKILLAKKEAQTPPEKAKTDKPGQDAERPVVGARAIPKNQSDTSISAPLPSKSPATKTTPVKRERERGSASVAARILQRDLGLIPSRSERRILRGAASAAAPTGGPGIETKKAVEPAATQLVDKIVEPKLLDSSDDRNLSAPTTPILPPTGPRISKTNATKSQPIIRPAAAPTSRPARPLPSPGAGSKSAFLKHANFSQGVTEELLLKVFSTFGAVTRYEIDRKKGFGYIDFEDAESLKKAMLSSPVKVGEKGGQVVVLENRNVRSKAQSVAQPSTPREVKILAQPQSPVVSPKPDKVEAAPKAPAVTRTPTAPRGTHAATRGGVQNHVPRGGFGGTPRGGFGHAGRNGRTNYRGRGPSEKNRGINGTNAASAVSAPDSITPLPAVASATEGNQDNSTG